MILFQKFILTLTALRLNRQNCELSIRDDLCKYLNISRIKTMMSKRMYGISFILLLNIRIFSLNGLSVGFYSGHSESTTILCVGAHAGIIVEWSGWTLVSCPVLVSSAADLQIAEPKSSALSFLYVSSQIPFKFYTEQAFFGVVSAHRHIVGLDC